MRAWRLETLVGRSDQEVYPDQVCSSDKTKWGADLVARLWHAGRADACCGNTMLRACKNHSQGLRDQERAAQELFGRTFGSASQ